MFPLPFTNPGGDYSGTQTHPGLLHSGAGTGLLPSAPPFLELVTGPATGELPFYPEVLGRWLLKRQATESASFLSLGVGGDAFGLNELIIARWTGGPWSHALTRLFHEGESGVTALSFSWWTWAHGFGGIETGLPPVYGNSEPETGGYNPIYGQVRPRRVDVVGVDDMPEWVWVGPWYP